MQHKGNSEGRWGALERPQAAFWGLTQVPLLSPFPEQPPFPGQDPGSHSWQGPSPLRAPPPMPAFLIGHGIHEGLFPALGGEGRWGGDVRVSQWGSVPQALEPGARHGQGEHV